MPLQTASQAQLPPPCELGLVEPIVAERTRFNSSRTHRYTLYRPVPSDSDPDNYVVYWLLNPSGADEHAVDRTVGKAFRFACRWRWKGRPFGGMYVINAFALRATDPEELYTAPDPVGRRNNYWCAEIVKRARLVVVGWGRHAGDLGRDPALRRILRKHCERDIVRCFSFNRDGTPEHLLYQNESTTADQLLPFFSAKPEHGAHD